MLRHLPALLLALTPLASADVHVLVASLDGAQQVPPVATGGSGAAVVTVDDVTRYVHVRGTYSGLGSSITDAHLHGLANAGSNAGILIALTFTGTTSGTYEGSAVLSAAQVTGVLGGRSYVNLHTAGNITGELRGQARYAPVVLAGNLDGTQAATGSAATGTYTTSIDRNTRIVSINGTYTGLSTPVTVAHLHGPAWFGSSAGVLIDLAPSGGNSGTFAGSATLTAAQVLDVIEGFTYINVHSAMFTAGEIRGQVIAQTLGIAYCQAAPNSTGTASMLTASGSPRVADNQLQLDAVGLPLNSFGFLIASQSSTQTASVAGSSGRICVSGPNIARFASTVQSSGATGTFQATLDLTLAFPTNPAAVVAVGDTWNFQAWHRDSTPIGATTSNYTNAVSINFR